MTHKEVLDEVNVIYERVSNNEHNLFSDGKYTEALEVLIDYYEVGLIEELEKIKTKINNNPQVYSDEYFVSVKFVNKVLDNHISELKGE